jgi:hypothetical protein
VGLDGVVAQQDNYRKSGFALAYRNIRFAGTGGGAPAIDPRIVDVTRVPFAAMLAYDRTCFPAERTAFLQRWLAQPDAAALARVNDGVVEGYGVVRRCRAGWKIGPLFADDAERAEALFAALAARVPAGEALFLDVPEPNAGALALAERHAMNVAFETARMYTGSPPALPLARLFGVTTFELG